LRLPTSSTHEGIRQCHRQNSTQQTRNFRCASKSTCPMAHEQKIFFEPFLKNKLPMLLKQPPTFFLQETHNFNSKTSTRPTYDVYCKGCSRRHQGQGVRKVCPTRTSPCTLRARKGSHPRNGFPGPKSDQSLKTTIGVDAELCLPIWHCGTREAFLMRVQPSMRSRNGAPSRPTRKPTRLM
jgi:hypothetical protein